jgi:hypothetical protein
MIIVICETYVYLFGLRDVYKLTTIDSYLRMQMLYFQFIVFIMLLNHACHQTGPKSKRSS